MVRKRNVQRLHLLALRKEIYGRSGWKGEAVRGKIEMKCPNCGYEFDKFLVTDQNENLYRCPNCEIALDFRISPFQKSYSDVSFPRTYCPKCLTGHLLYSEADKTYKCNKCDYKEPIKKH